MNLIKATIATAAVVTCCLGNSYPAQANEARVYRAAMRVCQKAFELNTMGLAAGPNSDIWNAAMRQMDPAVQKGALDSWNLAKSEIPSCSAIF